MKSITTIEKEYLLQRLELSRDLTHAISCYSTLKDKIPLIEKEIERLDVLISGCFKYETVYSNCEIDPIDVQVGGVM